MNPKDHSSKSTVEEIRARFDGDVKRFSNLETGQSATLDAPLLLELVTEVAARVTPRARVLLDVGCGAGNYTLKMLEKLPGLDVVLVDLSERMLARAVERITPNTSGTVTAIHGDIRAIDPGAESVDIILAAAVLHHLRGDEEWRRVFGKFRASLRPGGSLWISDLVDHSNPAVSDVMWGRYDRYLESLGGAGYREKVRAYIEREDTPRPLTWQLNLLDEAGFDTVEILHKNAVGAAYGAIRSAAPPMR